MSAEEMRSLMRSIAGEKSTMLKFNSGEYGASCASLEVPEVRVLGRGVANALLADVGYEWHQDGGGSAPFLTLLHCKQACAGADTIFADGEALLMPVPDINFKVQGKKRYFHRVVSGATLGGTADSFGVKTADLAFWNGLDPEAHLHPRMVLQVWVSKDFKPGKHEVAVMDESRLRVVESGSEEHLNEAERRIGRKRVSYSPRRPESLETIGAKYGLGRYDLARINHLSPSSIVSPGEKVLVYEVVDTTKSTRIAEQAKKARRHNRKTPTKPSKKR
jgi:LysM repeat protein